MTGETPTDSNDPISQPAEPTSPPTESEQIPTAEPAQVHAASSDELPKSKFGYYWGLGRRKSSVARVRIRPGDGKFTINNRPYEEYFKIRRDRDDVVAPLKVTDSNKRFDVFVNVRGGGTTGQAGAVVLGLSRALRNYDGELEPNLRAVKYLTRDSRKVERKKYGQRGARRRFQFSKR